MKWGILFALLLTGCGPFWEPEPEDPNAPQPAQCGGWCAGLRTCEGVTDDHCERDCRATLADPDELRVSGLTRKGMECVADAVGCDAIGECGP